MMPLLMVEYCLLFTVDLYRCKDYWQQFLAKLSNVRISANTAKETSRVLQERTLWLKIHNDTTWREVSVKLFR